MDQRCPKTLTAPCPPAAACPDCPPCPTYAKVRPEKEYITQYVTVTAPVLVPPGRPLVGANVVYFHGLGVQAVGGYQFKGGHWQVEGGPMYVPQNDTMPQSGIVKFRCYKVPWTGTVQDAKHPWGATVGFKYLF